MHRKLSEPVIEPIKLETDIYIRSDTRPPKKIFPKGFYPIEPSRKPKYWKDSIRYHHKYDASPDALPRRCISTSRLFEAAAIFPDEDLNRPQNQISKSYLYFCAGPKAVTISQDKEIVKNNNVIPAKYKDMPIDLHAFQQEIYFNKLASGCDLNTLNQFSCKLYAFETIFSSIPKENIIGAVRITRGPQCLEFYETSIEKLNLSSITRKFIIAPGVYINDNFSSVQKLPVIANQTLADIKVDYSSCHEKAINFMNDASRKKIWQAAKFSYGLMGKTVEIAQPVASTLFPPLDTSDLIKKIGFFNVDDLQYAKEDKELNQLMLLDLKNRT